MLKFVRTVLILIYGVSFIRCGKHGGIEIEIRQNGIETFCVTNNDTYYEEDQKIYIAYDVHNKNIIASSCYEKTNAANKFPTPRFKSYHKYWIVNLDMGTIWTCDFLINNEHRISCDFPVNVLFNVAAYILINNKPLKLNKPFYSATEYIVETRYEYDDDELVYITCNLISGKYGMRFSVNGPANESLIPSNDYKNDIQSIHLRAVLNKKYNLSNIDCIVKKTPNRDIIHRILVVPKKKASVNDDLIMRVNGLKLAGQSQGKTAVYEYQKDEILNITCEKNDNAFVEMKLSIEDYAKGEVTLGRNNFATINASRIHENEELVVTCEITRRSAIKLTLREASEKDVIIRGLVQRNIILSYNNEYNGNTTVYAYNRYEVLNLTWISGSSAAVYSKAYFLLTWKDKLLSHSDQVSLAPSKILSSLTIHLSPEDDGSTIQCIIYSHYHTVIFSIHFRHIITDNNINGNNKPNIAILVPVSSVICIFVMLAILCVIYKYCQTRNRFPEEANELNEGNGSSNNPTQFPETWDDYANAVMRSTQTSSSYVDLKYLYASPILKKDRQFKDQVVARENSLYEPMENDNKNLNKNFDERQGIPKYQNRKKYENLVDDSCDHESPNNEKELYSEVSLKG